MLFSEEFGVSRTPEDDWFDPILSIDTKLFIDPFLIYDLRVEGFENSHQEIVSFFDHLLQIVARSKGDAASREWGSAANLALFPEVEELCLGYTSAGTSGLGSGREFAELIVEGLWTDIKQGVENVHHFEHLQLFQEGIGRDRISDATAGILRHRFATYTSKVALRHKLEMQEITYGRATFDTKLGRWKSEQFKLPINPAIRKPVLLCPMKFLRPLPTINANDFWDYAFDNENELIRQKFGEDIGRNVGKAKIVELARSDPNLRREYEQYREGTPGRPYDIYTDKKGLVEWYSKTGEWVSKHPRNFEFNDPESFLEFVKSIIDEFTNYVENDGGWKLLWNDDGSSRSEEICQRVFLGIVKHYCRANEIDVSAEANIGRGPVDFKVSSGYTNRALIELKLARNTKWRNGLVRQLPTYMRAEDIAMGAFVIIAFNAKDDERIVDLQLLTQKVNQELPYSISSHIVSASKQLSASRL